MKRLFGGGHAEADGNLSRAAQRGGMAAEADSGAVRRAAQARHGARRHQPTEPGEADGVFVCAGCGQKLFASGTKFESGTGWPSFYAPLEGAVGTTEDRSLFMTRTEVHCSQCGGHLGHVFPDGPRPPGNATA